MNAPTNKYDFQLIIPGNQQERVNKIIHIFEESHSFDWSFTLAGSAYCKEDRIWYQFKNFTSKSHAVELRRRFGTRYASNPVHPNLYFIVDERGRSQAV